MSHALCVCVCHMPRVWLSQVVRILSDSDFSSFSHFDIMLIMFPPKSPVWINWGVKDLL